MEEVRGSTIELVLVKLEASGLSLVTTSTAGSTKEESQSSGC